MERLIPVLATLCLYLGVMDCRASEPIQIFLAGDSTMAEKTPEARPEFGWGEMLQGWFLPGDVSVKNHAKNGRSTKSFFDEGLWDSLLSEVNPGDYVFIQFGHNDPKEHSPERYAPPPVYRANLERFVSDVNARNATPVLLTPVVRRRFDENGAFYDTHGAYPDLVKEVASSTGAPLIDLHTSSKRYLIAYGAARSKELFLWLNPGESQNHPKGIEDNTHFSPQGARAMASLVMQGIKENVPTLAGSLQYLPGGIQQDSDVARSEKGSHGGGGETLGHWFFEDSKGIPFAFKKRRLYPGSAIGYHLHNKDEIYYVLEGNGELTFNGETSMVGPGTAIFTRRGDSHGLKAVDKEDLVIIIVYPVAND